MSQHPTTGNRSVYQVSYYLPKDDGDGPDERIQTYVLARSPAEALHAAEGFVAGEIVQRQGFDVICTINAEELLLMPTSD